MNKTLMIAATLLTLGAGSAFADGDVFALPAQVDTVQTTQQAAGQHSTFFTTSQRPTTSVYSQFRGPGYTQGGDN